MSDLRLYRRALAVGSAAVTFGIVGLTGCEPPKPATSLAGSSALAATSDGTVGFTLRCTGAKPCSGETRLRLAGANGPVQTYAIAAGATRSVTVTLNAAQKAAVAPGTTGSGEVRITEKAPAAIAGRGIAVTVTRPALPPAETPTSKAYRERNWSPTAYDTCSADLHRSFSVIGPDGKLYPTWHPPTVVDPATGRSCSFGHEHGDDPADRITLHNDLGVIAFSQGRFADAEAELRRAAELAAGLMGPQHLETLRPRGNMALAQYRQGRLEPALAELRHVAARYEELLGPNHPATAEMLANVGIVLDAQGHHVDSEAINRRVLDIRERALGADHPGLATALNNLSTSLHGQGRDAEAAAQLRRAVALLDASLGPEHPTTLTSRGNLAVLLKAEGDLTEAEAEYRRVLELQVKALGPAHPNLAGTRNNLANLLEAQGRYAEAEAEHRRALALVEATAGAETLEAANSRHNLALTLQAQGRLSEAEAEQRRAVALREKLLPAENTDLAGSRQRLADILLASGRASDARPPAEAAWRVLEREDGSSVGRAEAAFVLARVLGEQAEDRERARGLARQAEHGFEQAGPRRREDLEAVRTWLRAAGSTRPPPR